MIWDQFCFLPSVRRKFIAAGIASYRSLDDVMPAIFKLKQALSEQNIAGPKLLIAGPIFTIKGGHPSQNKRIPGWVLESMTVQSDDPVYVKQQIARLVEKGIDGVKVVYQSHTIEHGIRHGNLIDTQTMQNIVKNNIIYVPTLAREPQGHLNRQSGIA
jgi:hypothetical protein